MNKALSVLLPIFVAWGFLSAEERSEGSVQNSSYASEEPSANEIDFYEEREPAGVGFEEASVLEPRELADPAFEVEWKPQRDEMYSNVGLTETEIMWLNEIDDVTDIELKKVIQQASEENPYDNKMLLEATQGILAKAVEQKEEYIGTERYQYLLMAKGFFLEHYRIKTGKEIKARW